MKTRTTLGEKLKDLRTERNLRLADVESETGISTSTLQRIEADADIRIGYQDIEVLTRFYDVSADYLFGLTDNKQYRNVKIDKLRLSDEAIEVLKDGKLNNRLVSELISHEDFPQLLNAMEIYIDRKVQSQISTMNAMYKFVEQTLKDNVTIPENDEMMTFLQEAVVDEDEYLRFRISERFNAVMKSLFDRHKKDELAAEYQGMLDNMKEQIETFIDARKTESAAKSKATMLCKQLGLNTSKLTDEDWRVLMKILEDSTFVKRTKKRK